MSGTLADGTTFTTGTPNEFIDATTAAVFIPVLWSKQAVIAREAALLMSNRVNRVFETELTYGSSLHVPSIHNLLVQSKNSSANAAVIWETITEVNTDITVGTWEYQAIGLETFTKTQSAQDLMARYAPKQGYALALSIDAALTALGTSITNTVGSYTNDVDYEALLRAIQYLDDANSPQSDRYMEISPAQRAAFMKLDQFVNGDYQMLNGTINAATKQAMMGNFLGIPIGVSTNVNGSNAAGHDNLLFQKEAIALVVQMDTTAHTFFDINYLVDKAVVEHIFGQAIMRNDHAVNMRGA